MNEKSTQIEHVHVVSSDFKAETAKQYKQMGYSKNKNLQQ